MRLRLARCYLCHGCVALRCVRILLYSEYMHEPSRQLRQSNDGRGGGVGVESYHKRNNRSAECTVVAPSLAPQKSKLQKNLGGFLRISTVDGYGSERAVSLSHCPVG